MAQRLDEPPMTDIQLKQFMDEEILGKDLVQHPEKAKNLKDLFNLVRNNNGVNMQVEKKWLLIDFMWLIAEK